MGLVIQPDDRQWDAIRATDRHVLVSAGAGTGKTETVVGRILYLLGVELRGEQHPAPIGLEDLAAITFTNAAAADLKEKLRERLRNAGRRQDAYLVDTARIGTIHSFCADVLREFALRSGRSPAATVLDEAQGPLIVTEVVRDAVIEAVTAGQPPGLSDLLAEYSVGDVQSWTARLLAESDRLEAMIRNRDALGARERTIIDLATTARDLLNRRLEEMAAVDFDRIIVWTRDLLRDGPVRAVLQRRIHTLIVDEFQDVDPPQKEIAYLLGEPASRSRNSTRLMLVGDPKQSIYRFRRADVTVWRAVERDFHDRHLGLVVALEKNYRSGAPVLGFVDASIGPVLDSPVGEGGLADYEVPFLPVKATREDAPSDRSVELILVPGQEGGEKLSADDIRRREAKALAQRARELFDERGHWGGMAVLFTGWGGIHIYQSALEQVGAKTYALLQEGFYERREVLDMLVALQAIRDPWDDVALIGFLRGPLCGVKDETLLALARHRKGKTPYWRLVRDVKVGEQELLDFGTGLIRRLTGFRDRISTAELLERLIEESGYLAHLALLGDDGAQRVANVRKLVGVARNMPHGGVGDFIRLVEEARERQDWEGDARLYREKDEVVILTSVHSAKGLQWDVVFWCDLVRGGTRRGDGKLLVGRDRIVVRDPEDKDASAWTELHHSLELEDLAERKRVWYVAATRARDRLIVSGIPLDGKSFRGSPGDALLPLIRPMLASTRGSFTYRGQGGKTFHGIVRRAGPVPAAPDGSAPPRPVLDPQTLPPVLARLPVTAGRPRHSATELLSYARCPMKHWFKYVAGVREPPMPWAGEAYQRAITRGLIVHDVLERYAEEAELDRLLEDAIGRWDPDAPPPEGVEGWQYRSLLREEIQAVAGHPDYRAIADLPSARRELGFLHVVDGEAFTEGELDLAALEDEGLVLLDVKTGGVKAGAARDRAAHYGPQRNVYVSAAESIGGLPVKRFAFQFSRAAVQVSEPVTSELRARGKEEFERIVREIGKEKPQLTKYPEECRHCGYKRVGWCPGVTA